MLESICFIWFIFTTIKEFKKYLERQPVQIADYYNKKCIDNKYESDTTIDSSSLTSSNLQDSLLSTKLNNEFINITPSNPSILSAMEPISARYILMSIIKCIIWSFTLFISLVMQLNKLQFRFTQKDFGFVHENLFQLDVTS